MVEQGYRSKCCNAKIKSEGIPDFLGSKEVRTVSYICRKCNKPCDAAGPEGQKQRALEKRIKGVKKRLDFQGETIQKLVELLDGITIHPVRGVILTPKKKRQLAELREMEQKLFKSEKKKD